VKHTIVRFEGNEIILTGDVTDLSDSFITNLDELSYFLGDETYNSILLGMEVSQAVTPNLTVRMSAGIGCNVSTDNLILGDAVSGLAISTPDAVQDRYDTIQARRVTEDIDDESRQFKNPSTGVVSPTVIYTKTEYKIEYSVVDGTPGSGVAPNATAGWMKIAEIYVPAGSSTVIDSRIYNVDAVAPGLANTNWTAQTTATYRVGTIGELKTLINSKCYPSGAGFANNEVPLFADSTGKALKTSNMVPTAGGIMGDSATVIPTEDRIKNYLDSLLGPSLITWTSPFKLGSDFNISGSGIPTMCAMSPTRIAYFDNTNDSLRTYDFDGEAWSLVGSGFSISTTGIATIVSLSSSRIAFFDSTNDELRAYDFNGSTWSLVGSGLSISGAGAAGLAALSSSRVAFWDNVNNELRAYDFNGSTWSLVGNGLTITAAGLMSMTALSSSRIGVVENSTLKELRAYDFDGTDWVLVASESVSSLGATTYGITALNTSDVVFPYDGGLIVYRLNGSTWDLIGFWDGLTSSGTISSAITTLNGTDVVFFESLTDEDLRVFRFGFYLANISPHSVSGGAF
jgi:hypothetical protein